MQGVVIRHPGGPEVLEVRDLPIPAPDAESVLVRVRAFGLNRADLLQRRGLYPAPPDAPQEIPGLEYAGEIAAVGTRATGVEVGDRVMGIVGGGGYAQYLVTPADHTLPVPGQLSFEEAAAIPEVFITAHDALTRAGVVAGEWVLIHAVGSGVGTAAVQLVKARGATSIGTTRTAAKIERARALGMDHGIDTTTEEFAPAVLNLVEGGVNAAIDLVGGALFAQSLGAMASRGRIVLVGLTGGRHTEVDLGVILRKRLRIEGTVLRSRSRQEKSAVTAAFRAEALPLFASGTLRPVLDRTFAMNEIGAAHAFVEANRNVGKVVVTVDDDE